MFFSVYTLGCKLNQLETEAIADAFRRQGFTPVPIDAAAERPGVIVINTCTVTSMAEQKARRVIRKALRRHPLAVIIVTGCYAQMDKTAIIQLEAELSAELSVEFPEEPLGRLFVVPGEKKDLIMDLPCLLKNTERNPESESFLDKRAVELALRQVLAEPAAEPATPPSKGAFRFAPESFSSHSRAFIKIQDGCDRRCAYCRVSIARGKSQSLAASEVLKQLKALEQRGFAEAVLTGVNISQYRDSSMRLPGLLKLLLNGTEKIRLRLSSIEPELKLEPDPGEPESEFFEVLKNNRIRPHFHLSLQSGSAEVLAKMGRPYTPGDVEKAVERLRSIREDPFLACDIITGFPGETEDEFEKTLRLCEKIRFVWIHAFPFSPRPGTAAYDLPGKVSERDAVKRVELLTELARKGRREYIGRWAGKEVEAVVEAPGRKDLKAVSGSDAKTSVSAVSENYLKLMVNCLERPIPQAGMPVRCRILRTSSGPFDALAEIIAER